MAKPSGSYIETLLLTKLMEEGITPTTAENSKCERVILAGTYYNKQHAINMLSKLEALGYKPSLE